MVKTWSMTCALTVVSAILLCSITALAQSPKGPVPGRFIVKLSSAAKQDELSHSLSADHSLVSLSRSVLKADLTGKEALGNYFVFSTGDKSATAAGVKRLLGESNVISVEPDYHLEFFDWPGDSLFNYQWYLYNDGQPYLGIDRYDGSNNDSLVFKAGSPGVDVNLRGYYNGTPAEHTAVVVAFVDSGVDLVHPELQGQFWRNEDEIPGNGVDDDHNGYVDDTLGYDISGDVPSLFSPIGDNDPTDRNGHGTHLAGIVGSRRDQRGVVGVAPNAKIMAVKIRPNATTSVGAEGIIYAVNAGAKVINISWGTPFESGLLREVLLFARANGVLVAVAPGNSASNQRFYPAAFDEAFVVAAGNSDGYLTYFTTYGAHVDITAPGLDILSLRAAGTDLYAPTEAGVRIIGEDSLYLLADGTSMSTPVVAGAAALLWSIRPDLSLADMENVLRQGATDMVDPFGDGGVYPGKDTLSGAGYLDIDASLALISPEGLALSEPINQRRYDDTVAVKVLPLGGYEGSWHLELAYGFAPANWTTLAQGATVPEDSVIYLFSDQGIEGIINLRLTDKNSKSSQIRFTLVRENRTEISSPGNGAVFQYQVPISGSAYGPAFDSLVLSISRSGPKTKLYGSTKEVFDAVVYDWTVSGLDTGVYKILLIGYFEDGIRADSAEIVIKSAFAEGWPRKLAGRGALTPVVDDLDNDGTKEIIIATGNGLIVFHPDGMPLAGFPVLPGVDVRCIPAIYDVDQDGFKEIICTSSDGIHVFRYDGTYAEGWPQPCFTGLIPFNYSYPNPTVTRLGVDEDSAIVIINKIGNILAYEFNGDSYFYSLNGLFASFDPRISDAFGYGGSTSPFVTSRDFDGDGYFDVLGSYTSPFPYTGLGMFEGRTGRPLLNASSPLIETMISVAGTSLADLDEDGIPEIVSLGVDAQGSLKVFVKTQMTANYPGWPVALQESQGWVGSYPILADLDLDQSAEIIFTFFEFDVARLYIFRADGTPYAQLDGYPSGVAFADGVTFGTPTVGNLTGDEYPEIVFRSGRVFPGSGNEKLYILDHNAQLLPGWPVNTPAKPIEVFSARYAPLIDDIDNDGLVELMLISDNADVLVWNFEAAYDEGRNKARFLVDNLNSNYFRPPQIPTDVDDAPASLPVTAALRQNYPNPFNPSTRIEWVLPRRSQVSLDVFNILGQKVTTLVNGEMEAGNHVVEFDGSRFASGVYLYRLETEEKFLTKKMVLVK